MAGRLHDAGFLLLGAVALVHRRVEVEHFEFGFHIGHFAHADDDLAATLDDRVDCLVQGEGLLRGMLMVATSDRRRRRRRFNDDSAGILECRRWGWFSGGKKRRKGHKCLVMVLMELVVAVESVGTRRW